MASKGGLFGTNGIRGIVGREITPNFVTDVSMAIGTWVGEEARIILGMDTRSSGYFIKSIVSGTLISLGHMILDVGILPTPALQLFTQKHGDLGIMVTASHNPPEYNGIKVISGDGTEIDENMENEIENIFFKKTYASISWNRLGKISNVSGAADEYVKRIISLVNVEKIRGSGIRVLLDCSNGASFYTSPLILEKLGVNFDTVNCQPDGTFPSHLPEPREENLKKLMELVRGNYHIGAVHDGDADRVAFIDGNGRFVTGDKILALFTLERVRKIRGTVVVPVSVSMAVEEIARKYGSKVIYTRVGAPIVARKMIETGAVFGGEDNGGYIFPEMQFCRDGGIALARMIEILSGEKKSLEEKLKELPEYHNVKGNVVVKKDIVNIVIKKFRNHVEGKNILEIDGIKVFEGESWVLVRPSGTEPLIRIYAEARDKDSAMKIFQDYKKLIESMIREIE